MDEDALYKGLGGISSRLEAVEVVDESDERPGTALSGGVAATSLLPMLRR